MKTQWKVAYLASGLSIAALLLAACGGGGSSSGTTDPNAIPNGSQAQQQLASQQGGSEVIGESGPRVTATIAPLRFHLKPSAGAAKCIPNADAIAFVSVVNSQTERMHIGAVNLPPNTEFDVFLIQVPKAPFGLSWYQGDIRTNANGSASVDFIGRFSIETFIVAPGTAPAPVVFHNAFPDASSNPPTNPIHTYHVGMWFNSPADAIKAGCPGTVTPFNGPHNAGIQAMNTAAFPDLAGPLRSFHP